MTRVAVVGAASIKSSARWEASAGDLAIEVVRRLGDHADVDCLLVASPSATVADRQAGIGGVLADRLGRAGKVATYEIGGGDAAGAAAFHMGYARIRAGLSRAVLVLGVAKVTDLEERQRVTILDALVDAEGEGDLSLTYASLCGLLADLYTQRYPEDRRVFQRVVAKNAANAMASDETFIRHAPSLAEVIRDFPVATPLVRSDFAPLIDGATAVLLTDLESARAVCETVVEVVGVAAAADVSVVADRVDALRLHAVTEATAAAVDPQTRRSLRVLETHNPCSVLEVLTLESAGFIEWGHAGRAYREGFGLRTSALPVNPGGGSQGRGLAFGVSGLEQTRELFLQLSGAAGSRQVESARTDPEARGLAIATAGLATCAYATVLGKAQ